jgi:ABC-type transport system involved in multi-copper enzyme maturation permease subunit
MLSHLKNVMWVTRYTFIEIYKSRIMYSVVFLGLFLLFITLTAGEFTYGVPQRVALDFGLGCLSLSSVGIAIFIGCQIISKEVEQRTLYMILSRPIQRWSFLLGRMAGLFLILLLNVTLLGIMVIIAYRFLGGTPNIHIVWSFLFSYIESVIMLLVVINFSLVTNVTMSVIYSLVVFVLGHSITQAQNLTFVQKTPLYSALINIFQVVIPDLSKINLKTHILYENFLSPSYISQGVLYSVCYCLALMALGIIIFERKSLD